MIRRRRGIIAALAVGAALVLSACSATPASSGGTTEGTHLKGAPSWCGTKKISFALLDGFGGNSWRLVTTASGKDEASKCASVTQYLYADGQGNTQKEISDIKGMVAKGVGAMVVFPDAGKAELPALTSAFKAGVVTVPYRDFPGGKAGVNYTQYIASDPKKDAENWSAFIKSSFPGGANILFLSGPPGNTQGVTEQQEMDSALPANKYTFLGDKPFNVTNWDPSLTQQVLTAAIAKYPKIDVIVSDFGPSIVGALPSFTKSNRQIPTIVASDGNTLSCFYEDNKAANPKMNLMTVATGNDNVRLAVDYAIAKATGGTVPSNTVFEAPVFENTVTNTPNGAKCDKSLPGDVYLSAKMSGTDQAALLGK
jgi:ribose transport system substrate-binding protein